LEDYKVKLGQVEHQEVYQVRLLVELAVRLRELDSGLGEL
jgi:hypothetical protein